MKLGNPHGPKPFTAEARQQGVEAQRQQADARAQQLSEILFEFAGQSANAVAKALNDRGLRRRAVASGRRARSSTSEPGWRMRRDHLLAHLAHSARLL